MTTERKIFAHGAVNPCKFESPKRAGDESHQLWIGASCFDKDYPVVFSGLDEIRDFHEWLGNKIHDADLED